GEDGVWVPLSSASDLTSRGGAGTREGDIDEAGYWVRDVVIHRKDCRDLSVSSQ
ncbi:Hypothetical predicted protein, partial [Pelobates cultripes]